VRPSTKGPGRETIGREGQAQDVDCGVVQTEMHDLRGQETPPPPGEDCGAVVAQEVGHRAATQRRTEQEYAGRQQPQAVAAVAVEGASPIT
jgi:hypothetical protein